MHLFKRKSTKGYTYYVRYSENGKVVIVSTRETKKDRALKFLSNFQKEIEKRKDEKFTSIPINKLIWNFLLTNKHNYTEITIKNMWKSLSLFQRYTGDITTSQINKNLVQTFLNSKTKYAGRLYYSNLNVLFKYAIENGFLAINPLSDIKKPKTPTKIPLYITEKQLSEVLTFSTNRDLKDFIGFAFYSGMRLSEIINLRWQDIDFNHNFIILSNQTFTTKSRKPRVIPMARQVLEILGRLKQDVRCDFIFADKENKRYKPDYISKSFKKLVKKSNINQSVHFHSLRHSFASSLVNCGTPIQYVKELLGHQDISTTLIYSHLNNQVLTNAINQTFN